MSFRDLLLACVVVVLWGMNFVVIKVGVAHFPPFLFLALRFVVVAVIVLPFVRLTRAQLPWMLLLSFVFGSAHFGLMFVSFARIDAATGAILTQLGVPFSTLLAALFLKDKLGIWRLSGLSVAFLGAALLAGEPQMPDLVPFLTMVLAAMAWAVANLLVKRVPDMSGFAMTGWISLFAVPQAVLWSLLLETGQWEAVRSAAALEWAAVLYVSIGSSVIAYTAWYYLLAKHPVSAVVPFTLLAPVLGVIGGVLLLDEPLTWQRLIGGALTIGGVGVILLRQARRGQPPAPPGEGAAVTRPPEPPAARRD